MAASTRSRPTATRTGPLPVLAALVLAGACSRPPGPPSDAAREAVRPSPPAGSAEAHLALGEEARESAEYPRARRELETARVLFEKGRRWEGFVRAGIGIGGVARVQGDYEAALDHLNAALATAREKLGERHPQVARALQELGAVHVSTGRPREGLALLAQAIGLRRALKSPPADVAETLRRMAMARMDLGEDEEALALLDEAEALLRAAPGARHPRLADTLILKGGAYWGQGRYDQAAATLEEAVAILEEDGGKDRIGLAAAYINLGNAYWSKTDYDEARAYFEKALPLQVAVYGEAHPQAGTTHYNMAVLHSAEGDYEACLARAETALRILVPALGEKHPQVVHAHNVLAEALTATGEPDRALAVLGQALTLQRSLPEAGDRAAAVIDTNLARAYEAKGDFTRALRHHRRALAFDRSLYGERHPDVAEDLVLLGTLHLAAGDEDEALRDFGRAIAANCAEPAAVDPDLDPPLDSAFSEDVLLKALQGAARARARRGASRDERPELERAARVYEHASRLIDRMRVGYRAEGSKLSIGERAKETYEEAIRTELELHRFTGDERRLAAAFGYAERSRAGALRDALHETKARSFAGIPPEALDRERRLRADLAVAERKLTEARLERTTPADRLASRRDLHFALMREYAALQQRLERDYPAYYDLKYRSEAAGLAEIRERLLDERTILVEYFLGKERITLFTVTRKDLQVASVPRGESLEADLRELRRAILERDQAGLLPVAHRLYLQLLAPVEHRLEGRDLLVVPDGLLSSVPFEALLKRAVASPTADLPWVLRDHATSYAYSATVALQGLARRRADPLQDFVGFAPLAPGSAAEALPPLPASRKEVTDTRALFARRQGFLADWFRPRSHVYLGRDATETRLKSAGLDRYRYVHLATHGIVDEEHPGRSRLLLAPEAGSAEDGLLHLGEVYGLRLNADLVVLSACDTGRGRVRRGEGIVGLTRGFLYAGARSLLVSLWPVSDAAAAELVVGFYDELLAGRPSARALREAKLRTMGRNPEYAKPYYWSSFVLVGGGR